MNKKAQSIIFISALVLLSVGAAAGLRAWLHPPLHLQATTLLPEPNVTLEGYGLTQPNGATYYFDNAKDHWVLLLLAHNHCADCPQTLHALGEMLKPFAGVDSQYTPKVIFINLDQQDKLPPSPQAFHPDISGATGSKDELARLTTSLAVSGNDTTISSRIYIIDPQLRYIGYFTPPHQDDVLYSDMQQLIHELWRYHAHR